MRASFGMEDAFLNIKIREKVRIFRFLVVRCRHILTVSDGVAKCGISWQILTRVCQDGYGFQG